MIAHHVGQHPGRYCRRNEDSHVAPEIGPGQRLTIVVDRKAAALVEPSDVVLIDGGPIAISLAEELKLKKDITVITNSVVVFETLNRTPGITLISTGGAVRYQTQVLVGPTAEGALRELRADKLFLMASGITLDFGLSHHTISEVTMKQAMGKLQRVSMCLRPVSSGSK